MDRIKTEILNFYQRSLKYYRHNETKTKSCSFQENFHQNNAYKQHNEQEQGMPHIRSYFTCGPLLAQYITELLRSDISFSKMYFFHDYWCHFSFHQHRSRLTKQHNIYLFLKNVYFLEKSKYL